VDHTQAPPQPPRPTIVDPISNALEWTGKVLFRPFDIGKWIVLGFCAWLAALGEGGGGGSYNWNLDQDEARHRVEHAYDWVLENLELILFLGAVLVLVGIVFWVLVTWVSSRGKFMFLDGVVHDRSAVVEPWNRFSSQGNSLFLFRILLAVVGVVVIGAVVGLMVLSLLATGFDDHDPGAAGILFLFLWVLVIVALAFAFALVAMALNDFVVPVMWVRGCRVMEAWSEFLSLLSARPGIFILYVLVKIIIAVVVGLIACVVTCVTCCIAAIPYVGTVILLPLHVFRRSFSIYFLSQFDPDYAGLAPARTPAAEAATESST
jgi:hypothetical protein